MPCQILVSYQSGRPTGDIVAIVDDAHKWGRYESLDAWVADNPESNTLENWPRKFTVIKVSDRDVSELEYLKDRPVGREGKYYLGVPSSGTPEYTELATTGAFSGPWSKVSPYLMERT